MTDRAELAKKLNDEGDFGTDYVEELLNIADLDGDVKIGVGTGRASVAVVTEGVVDRRLKRLIGQGGEALGALQELIRLAVQARAGEHSRLMPDIADCRGSHRQEIAAIAREAVASILVNGEPISPAPMDPSKRKVVYDVVVAAGLASDSEGLGNARHVIVSKAAAADESLEEGGSSEEGAVSDSVPFGSDDIVSAGVADDASVDIVGESTDPIDGENADKSSASSTTK